MTDKRKLSNPFAEELAGFEPEYMGRLVLQKVGVENQYSGALITETGYEKPNSLIAAASAVIFLGILANQTGMKLNNRP